MPALVLIKPFSCSVVPVALSSAVIDWWSAVILPAAKLVVDPEPYALPTPTTGWPTAAVADVAVTTVFRPEAPTRRRTATSTDRS